MLTAEEKRELELFNELAESDPESLSDADLARGVELERKSKEPASSEPVLPDYSQAQPVNFLQQMLPERLDLGSSPIGAQEPVFQKFMTEAPRKQADNTDGSGRSPEKDYLQRQLFPNIVSYRARKTSDEAPVLSLGQTAAGLKDLSTLPLRLLLPEDPDSGIGYTSDNAKGFLQSVAADPTVLPLTVALGGANLPVRVAGSMPKSAAPYRVLAATVVGAGEGALGSVASDLATGRDVSPLGIALGAGGGALLTAPFAAARQVRVGDLPADVGELAYSAGMGRKAVGAKGLDKASERVLRSAKDVDRPHADVLEKAQNQINDALLNAEQRMKELRRSNRITAADFKKGTEGRQAVIDNLMAEGTWLTPEALMREARRVRSADPDLAQSLEDIAVDRLWQATAGRALTAAGDFRFGFDTPLEEVGAAQDALMTQALEQTKHLPPPKALLDAQKSGAAASALYKGLPGGKPAVAGQIIEKWTGVPFIAPAAGAVAKPLIVPFSNMKEQIGPQSSLIEIPEGDLIPEQRRGIIKFG